MASKNFEIKGLTELQAKLKKISNIPQYFNSTVASVAVKTLNSLIQKTPVDDLSGLTHTKNLWKPPAMIASSVYHIDNTKTSQDGKHAIAGILNYGRPEVRPKRAKRLYIPLSRKAKNRNKKYGAPIPDDFEWGKDFVLAKKSKAVKPTHFIDDIIKKMERVLLISMIKKVRKDFK